MVRFRNKVGVLIVLAVFFLSLSVAMNAAAAEEKININTASAVEFQALKGIGETIAQRIIDYRETNGLFKATDEIKNTKGVGNKIFENIKDKITVGSTVN